MADDGGSKYELGRLILDYLRAFMWPGVVVIFGLLYWQDVLGLIEEREVNIFGLEVGPAVNELQATTQQELLDVQALVEELKASYRHDLEIISAQAGTEELIDEAVERAEEAAEGVETKLESLRENFDQETLAIVQNSTNAIRTEPEATTGATTRGEKAAAFERQGFTAILARRLDDAVAAFENAYEVWPEYHNVEEIARYLTDISESPKAEEGVKWEAIERRTLTEFSWGMPDDLRQEFRSRTTSNGPNK